MSETKLSKEEVQIKLNELLNAKNLKKSEKTDELSVDQLSEVTGGVGAWAFKKDGFVWSWVCNNDFTTNPLFEHCLSYESACQYASAGATSCFNCSYLYVGNMGIPVESSVSVEEQE